MASIPVSTRASGQSFLDQHNSHSDRDIKCSFLKGHIGLKHPAQYKRRRGGNLIGPFVACDRRKDP